MSRFIIVKTARDPNSIFNQIAYALDFDQYRVTCGEDEFDAFVWARNILSVKEQVREWRPAAIFSDESMEE